MGPFWSLNDGMYNKHFTIVSYNLQQHRITIKAFHWSTFLGNCALLVSKFQCTNVTGEIHEIYSTLELCQSVMVDVKFGRRQIENRLLTKTRKKICQTYFFKFGRRHSTVVLSAPSILWPQVRIPSTPSMLFQFIMVKIETVIVIAMKKDENKLNRGRDGPFLNNF